METTISIIGLVIIAVLLSFAFRKKKVSGSIPSAEVIKSLLEQQVAFYQSLPADKKVSFEERVLQFLQKVRVTGVNTTVEDLDKVLVGAGAIIPIFAFPGWQYRNINEVLLYPGSFNETFA
jgi:Mlc titration factor MtfA (ptsG expression regulator)